jgi:Ca2+-binding EF-hand superfamily protein
MKRFAAHLGLLVSLAPATLAFAQDKETTAPRQDPPTAERGQPDRQQAERGQGERGPAERGQEGGRFRPGGDRPREGMGRGDFGPGRMMARLPIMMALDTDQDGEISSKEIDLAIVSLKKLDKNGDGKITMEEMMPSMEGPGGFGGPGGAPGGFGGGPGGFGGPGVDPQTMVARLMEGDKDNDGYLSESELPERMRPMMTRADTDGDKKISRDELTAVAQRMSQGPRGGDTGRGGEEREREGAGRDCRGEQRPPREGDGDRPTRSPQN